MQVKGTETPWLSMREGEWAGGRDAGSCAERYPGRWFPTPTPKLPVSLPEAEGPT